MKKYKVVRVRSVSFELFFCGLSKSSENRPRNPRFSLSIQIPKPASDRSAPPQQTLGLGSVVKIGLETRDFHYQLNSQASFEQIQSSSPSAGLGLKGSFASDLFLFLE